MTTRSLLPQNYVLSPSVLLEGFQTIGDWSLIGVAAGTIDIDSTFHPEGTQSIQLTTSTTDSYHRCTYAKTIDLDMSNINGFSIRAYVYDPEIDMLRVDFSSVENMSKYFSYQWTAIVGEGIYQVQKSEFGNTGGDSWSSRMIKMRIGVYSKTAAPVRASFGGVRVDGRKLPKCLITFDDGLASVYTIAFPVMEANGIKGTIYVIPARVGTTGYCTLSQLHDMYDAGWAMANHTFDHTDLTTLSRSQQSQKVTDAQEWLDAQGFSRAARHVAYPGWSMNADTPIAMRDAGMLTGRGGYIQDGLAGYMLGDQIDWETDDISRMGRFTLASHSVVMTTTLAQAKSMILRAINSNIEMQLPLGFHSVDSEYAYAWDTANFTELMNWIAQRKIPTCTIDEWYNGLTNPRYRSLPVGRA